MDGWVTVNTKSSATFTGGGFIVGLSEIVYTPNLGLAWAVMPITTTLSFLIGGVFLAKPMRDRKFVTMMDPFRDKYGPVISGLFSVAVMMNDVVWVPATLIGLDKIMFLLYCASMSVILDLSYTHCVWISATVAIVYTMLGGLVSVAYTDIVQLTLVFLGLWLCVPFLMMNPYSVEIATTAFNFTYQAPWVNSVDPDTIWRWMDQTLLLMLGNLACQDYYQRILSASSSATARMVSFIAAPVFIIFAIPPVLIGAVAASTDWNKTGYGLPSPFERGETSLIMPIALQYLTPNYISVIGISATTAAVMSTVDSLLLSAVSLFMSSIYKGILRTKASDKEVKWVIRIMMLVTGLTGTCLAFLELICVLFFDICNGYGAVTGVLISVVLRLLSGEPSLGLPVTLRFPGCTLENGVYVQHAPVNTLCMLFNFVSTLLFSYLASLLFNKGLIPERFNILKVKPQQLPEILVHTSSETVKKDNDQTRGALSENEIMLEESCSNNETNQLG
ncbi:high-affinity choline transporter 1-like [Syngnathoides biaculeatus]|uniref:high-affinity choline transporter 1-like n=1 Tax=Syngnathoides biaculeatus TaxID=300417 RepID=UPI002ADE118E|nr:high-affinity choline transporter 1-like [Syngnathoides biaculeatus]